MAREADRVSAGDRQISATRTLNPVIEQANRLARVQGGPGIMSQNDPTGLQLRGRRRDTMDGDSPYNGDADYSTSISTSSPWRKTIRRRSDSTRHKNEIELYNSSTVSAAARDVSSSRPARYGIPYLLTSSSTGNATLEWASPDADFYGSSGPRSIERRSTSEELDVFQLFRFDEAAATLGSSEVVQIGVRRLFGAGNHYLDWVNSSDLIQQASLPAGSSGDMLLHNGTTWTAVGTSVREVLSGAPVWNTSTHTYDFPTISIRVILTSSSGSVSAAPVAIGHSSLHGTS